MARIAGVNIPTNKHIRIALTYIYGVGPTTAEAVLKQAGVEGTIKTKDLTEDQVKLVREILEKGRRLEGDLKRDTLSHIKRLKEISSYRGSRHAKHLPARGQSTKSNSRTVRGNVRKTTGSGRRALTKT